MCICIHALSGSRNASSLVRGRQGAAKANGVVSVGRVGTQSPLAWVDGGDEALERAQEPKLIKGVLVDAGDCPRVLDLLD